MLMSFYLLTRYFVENFSVFFVKKIVLAIMQYLLIIIKHRQLQMRRWRCVSNIKESTLSLFSYLS